MGEFRINITELAKKDILGIADYIENNLLEPSIAVKTTEAILDAILTLEDMPARVCLVNDERLARKQVRGLYVKNYTVFFRIDEIVKTVDIIHVMYSRRDWATLLL